MIIIVHVIFDVIISSLSVALDVATLDVDNISEVLGMKTVNPKLEIKYEANGSLDVVVSKPTVDVVKVTVGFKVKTVL